MEKTTDHAKSLMETGWQAREDLNFELAEKSLTQAKTIFEELEDWFNLTECLNHLAYTNKLKANQLTNHGISLTNKALAISKAKNTKNSSVLRASISLLSASGNYEGALKKARLLLKTTTNPANKADLLQQTAKAELRTGDIMQAKETIEEAEKLLAESWQDEKEPHRLIWKVSVLLTKGLIYYNMQNSSEAKRLGQEALDLATQAQLKTRISQVQAFLDMIE